jgi:hypothetical protein
MNEDYQTLKEVTSLDEAQKMVQGEHGWHLLSVRVERPEPEESGAFKEKFIYLLGTTAKWQRPVH